MVSADRYAVEIADGALDEGFLYIPHEAQGKFGREDASVLCLVFFEDVGLNGSANLTHRFRLQLGIHVGRQYFVSCASEEEQP